jgi:F-type H+-transporting ATPase subunit delta
MPHAVVNRYANALADAVLAPGSGADPAGISAELHSFEDIVNSVPELKHILLSPAVSNSRKRAVVARLAQTLPLAKLVRNFLYVLIDRRRADLLNEVATAFDAAIDERLGRIRAEVRSAAPLADAQKQELENALSQATGKRVRCDYVVDDSLIGGIVARIGSTVYDGSVRTQLHSMQQLLMS